MTPAASSHLAASGARKRARGGVLVGAAAGGGDEVADEVERVAAVDRAGRRLPPRRRRPGAAPAPASCPARSRSPASPARDEQQGDARREPAAPVAASSPASAPSSGRTARSTTTGDRRRGPASAGGGIGATAEPRRASGSGPSGSGLDSSGSPTVARQRQPERRALARLAPRLQPAAVQPGVLDGDGQPEPGAAAAPGPRLLGPPEPVEHQLRLARPQADAVVADQHRDGVLVGRRASTRTGRASPWSIALATRLRTIRSTRRGSTSAYDPVGSVQLERRCRVSSANPRTASTARTTTPCMSTRSAPSSATPASSRLISSRSPSSASNRSSSVTSSSELRRNAGSSSLAGRVEHVGGHPDRGQRGAQLVADVGGEPPLQRAELLQLADLLLDAARHLVVGLAEAGQLVLALHGHALVEVAVGEPLGDLRGRRTGRTTCRVTRLAMPASSSSSTSPPTISVLCTRPSVRCSASRAGTAGRTPGRRSRCAPAARSISVGTSTPCSSTVRTCTTACPSATRLPQVRRDVLDGARGDAGAGPDAAW